ncbi:MAG: hypothetical protein FJ202_12435 [Gemmatimonadetes bacterium]|nr:hypothetical protein [Gemmatimonadota bacterium]
MLNGGASSGARALLLTIASGLVGGLYFSYLTAEPFPPDIVRLVPIAWFVAAVLGGALATRSVGGPGNKVIAWLAVALSVPNALFAAVFSLAALMGD